MSSVLFALLGLVGLVVGSDIGVAAAHRLARRLGVSPLIIGLTLASVGTSLPEIATNVAAAISGAGGVDASGLAVGNIIGSNLSQITLLIGITALISPLQVPRGALRRDGRAAVAAMVAMFIVCLDGRVAALEGWLLIGAYAAYVGWLLIGAPRVPVEEREPHVEGTSLKDTLHALGGIAVVAVSADVLVGAGVTLAEGWGVDPSLVGLFVGLGTGIPELVVALRASMQGVGELGLGNLLGSNITDPLLSFGLGAVVHPIAVPDIALRFDFPWWMVATIAALLLMRNQRQLDRREAVVLLLMFGLFSYQRIAFFS